MPANSRPNILFITVDQWRADCLGFTGHPVVETPHLDRLARDGINFSRAYSATPTCVPARAAMFTGLNQRHHGFVGYDDTIDWEYEVTLPGWLAENGYQAQAVGKMHVQPTRNPIGFDDVVLHDGYLHRERSKASFDLDDDYLQWLRQKLSDQDADYIDTGIGCNGYVARPWIYDEMLHPTAWVTTQSINFLKRRDASKPFFLTMAFVRPHPPLDPPEHYWNRYSTRELPAPHIGDWTSENLPAMGWDSPVPSDRHQIDIARRAYYAQMTYIDHQLNRIFMALFEVGELDNTAVMFVSDHGDMLFDHNMVYKASAFEASARVPLILRLPESGQWRQVSHNVDQPVELRDIFPTFCDLAGVDVPDVVDGRSLLPLIQGQTSNWRDFIHGEHSREAESNHWITDGREKYIWFSQTGRELMFNLELDPTEMHDLSSEKPSRVTHWRSLLIRELEGREEGFVQDQQLVAGRPQRRTLTNAGRFEKR